MLRYVDSTRASIWVETSEPCVVTVCGRWGTPTFAVHGHHYAIVDLEGFEGEYTVELNGEQVWPESDRPSRIRLLPPEGAGEGDVRLVPHQRAP
ncbi:hypothetical protein [Nonomuraea dietziae]|uniref:DUF7800 domain-containing protein n=1 Tax=Nonomuraea dietziae TaxID=65515 RepID=UPI0031D11F8B